MVESVPSAGPVAAAWFKSSYSGGEGNECVEVAHLRTRVGVRDSKSCEVAALSLPFGTWSSFVHGVKHELFQEARSTPRTL